MKIYFENSIQKVLWDEILTGQIVDGYWSNEENTDWEKWCLAETIVAPTNQ